MPRLNTKKELNLKIKLTVERERRLKLGRRPSRAVSEAADTLDLAQEVVELQLPGGRAFTAVFKASGPHLIGPA